jgi:ketosteroid isomerase-like protein
MASVTMAFALMGAVPVALAGAQESRVGTDQTQILNTVRTIFTAAGADDVKMFDSVIASNFYIFDVGKRFDGDAIMGTIKAAHAAGTQFEWNVTNPDVHVSGNIAWVAYVNQGSITDASGRKDQQWLESAVLQKRAGVWKILFMHSTRVPQAAPAAAPVVSPPPQAELPDPDK